MRFFYFILLVGWSSLTFLNAQNKDQLFFKVVDLNTKKAIPYVTIRFANNKNGTIANVLGDFRIPMRYKREKDTLILSCIGYSTKRIVLNSLKEKPYHILFLSPKTEQLGEVVINAKDKKKLSARQIVKKAIDNIKYNYPKEPFSYIGYYRDYQFVDEKYINLNEGITEVFDQGFLTHKISDSLNATALYSYKLNTEFTRDTLLNNSIYNDTKQIRDGEMGSSIGNELTLLDIHNPIRNYKSGSFSFVYIFEKDFVKNHKFYKKRTIFLDEEELYEIEFSAKPDVTGSNYKATGFIYISKEDFAIHRFDYKLYSESLKKLVFTVDIEYKRQDNDKMYLNYITFNNNFFITPQDVLKIKSWRYSKEKKSFFIEFNRHLDTTIAPRLNDVKVFFKDRRLGVKEIYFSSPKAIKVKLKVESSTFMNPQNIEEKALFVLKLRNFRDVQGFEMGKSKVEGYQFRELFVQRVFVDKMLNTDLLYVIKGRSLKDAPINDFNTEDYWLNSPLKTNNN